MSTESTQTVVVIEGGGLRGAFVAGALQHLVESKEDISHIYATSAGAASAAYAIAGQIEQAVQIWQERTHGRQLISMRRLLRGRRVMDIEGMVEAFRTEYPLNAGALEAAETKLFVAVTDCHRGKAAYVRATASNLFELLRATMALPVVYGGVVPVSGMSCIDGGITAAIPYAPALELNPSKLIVVSTRPLGFRKAPVRLGRDFLSRGYPAFPNLAGALRNRVEVYNQTIEQLEQLEQQGRVVVIRPRAALPASRFTRDRARIVATLDLGLTAAREVLGAASPDD